MEISTVICPRCNRAIDTQALWVTDTIDGLTCVECLTEEEHYSDENLVVAQEKLHFNKQNYNLNKKTEN